METLTSNDQPKFKKIEGWAKPSAGLGFRMVSNISADSLGRIYVVHRGPKPLRRFDLDGNCLGSVADSHLTQSVNYDLTVDPPRPIGEDFWLHGLHVDSWDHIWVTDIGRHLVFKFDLEGELLLTLGTPYEAGEDPEHFYQPTQVAVGRLGTSVFPMATGITGSSSFQLQENSSRPGVEVDRGGENSIFPIASRSTQTRTSMWPKDSTIECRSLTLKVPFAVCGQVWNEPTRFAFSEVHSGDLKLQESVARLNVARLLSSEGATNG